MRTAGFAHALAKARLLAELLDDAHAVDHFVEAIVDIGQIGAHPAHNWRAITLVNHHDDQHRREDGDRHQRHAPVEAEHRHQHRANQRRAAQHGCHHGNVQIADHLGIVGHTRNHLPNRLDIKLAERLAKRRVHHIGTQLLNHAHGCTVKQQRLRIVQSCRRQL